MDKLEQAVEYIREWQKAQGENDRRHRCLECVRYAATKAGLELPPPEARPDNTALCNFRAMEADPAKYGWQAVHNAQPKSGGAESTRSVAGQSASSGTESAGSGGAKPTGSGVAESAGLPGTYLAYFDDCGNLPDGRVAGHIGIVSKGVICSNIDYNMDPAWSRILVGAFVPE